MSTVVRSGLAPRLPRTHKTLAISERQLAALVAGGNSDTDIAVRYGVSTWAVTRRRRASGLRRPNQLSPPISRARLVRHLATGKGRADIATRHHVGLGTVTRWCAHYGLEVGGRPRPDAATHIELDPTVLRRLYVGEGWTAVQIGGHLGVDANLITFALHTHRIPVRRAGSPTRAGSS